MAVDRESRYTKKGAKGADTEAKVTKGDEKKVEASAGGDKGTGGDGAEKKTPGADPADSPKSEFGEISARHQTERGDMHKRHQREHEDTHSRHQSEHADMNKRHAKEIQEFMDKSGAGLGGDATMPSPNSAGAPSPAVAQGGAPNQMGV